MKIFKPALILLLAVAITGCSKSGDNVDKTNNATPLVKTVATTTRNYREVFNYGYDDQKRQIVINYTNNTSNITATTPVTYSLGGFQMVNTSEANTQKIIDFNLENGHIKTAAYNIFVKDVNQNLPVSALFSYDTKGRLIKIEQTISLKTSPPNSSRELIYTFTWDDNDNLIASNIYNPAEPPNQAYKITYSGFSAENANTVAAKNFGFDYFGATSYTGQFYPSGDGGSGAFYLSHIPAKFYHQNGQLMVA